MTSAKRLDRLEGPAKDITTVVVVEPVDEELLDLKRRCPCLGDHKAPPDLDEQDHLKWIQALLEHHRRNGPCHRPDRNEDK